jgi:hypothetical protein
MATTQSGFLRASEEQHASDRRKDSKKDNRTDASCTDSIPTGTKRSEPGSAEKVRRKINGQRDNRTTLGTCLPADIVID